LFSSERQLGLIADMRCRVLEPVSYDEGEAIFLAGDKPEWFYVLVSGWAEETHEGAKV
jgi:CRP-like cAMP-binding protein